MKNFRRNDGQDGGAAGVPRQWRTWARIGARTGARLWAWLNRHARAVLGVYWLCLLAGTHWPNLQLVAPAEEPGPLAPVLGLDKVLHAVGFGGLMVLLILSGLFSCGRSWAGRCGIALGIAGVYALADELTQGLMAGREVSPADVVTNLLAIFGVYLVAVLPSEREPRPVPRRLAWALVVSLGVMGVLALLPGVVDAAEGLKRSVLGQGVLGGYRYDHVGHGVLAAGLAAAVFAVWPMTSRRPRVAGFWAIVLLVLAGPGLEVAQSFTGRGVESADAVAHGIGVLLAMMGWAARLSWSPTLRQPAAPANATSPPA